MARAQKENPQLYAQLKRDIEKSMRTAPQNTRMDYMLRNMSVMAIKSLLERRQIKKITTAFNRWKFGQGAKALSDIVTFRKATEEAPARASEMECKLQLERKAHEKTRTDLARMRKTNSALHDKLERARQEKEQKVAKMHEKQKFDSDNQRAVADKKISALLER